MVDSQPLTDDGAAFFCVRNCCKSNDAGAHANTSDRADVDRLIACATDASKSPLFGLGAADIDDLARGIPSHGRVQRLGKRAGKGLGLVDLKALIAQPQGRQLGLSDLKIHVAETIESLHGLGCGLSIEL